MGSSICAQFPLIAEIDEIGRLDYFCSAEVSSTLLYEINEAWICQVSFSPPEIDFDNVLFSSPGEYIRVGCQSERQRLGNRPVLVHFDYRALAGWCHLRSRSVGNGKAEFRQVRQGDAVGHPGRL